ncbi:hypothetical protein [Sulfitobacter dubius]|uniref:Uncharacterized protein n=1 Tax=Sulfitobacter dubius TaxID=218673 RepID=A0ABY3ZK60_9RHOB|nr:hypothetical protein [Sulfitobacter dubius]UOA14036.1 hypothetical protein DSM109990_00831 [Sulfitobacter dubius]
MSRLKQELYDTFGGFADKRITNISSGKIFIVDDRKEGDFGANKRLYSTFCQILATVIDENTVTVDLRGNVPDSERVRKVIEELGGAFTESGASLTIARGEQGGLFNLSRAITAITGKRYSVASYKYVCPRTAKSLRHLMGALNKAWREDP